MAQALPVTMNRDDPSSESSDYVAMKGDWKKIDDICAGAERIKHCRQTYLPQFTRESDAAYKIRLQQAPWRPEFADGLRNLCSKPFTKPVTVNEDAPEQIQGKMDHKTKRRVGGFVEDIDGRGNSLHVFSRDTFVGGVKRGLQAIYVTFPDAPPARTQADEKASGVRPYWVGIEAPNIKGLYTKQVGGREVVEHIRVYECTVERDGFAETTVERIRVIELDPLERPTSRTYRKNNTAGGWEIEKEPEVLTGVSEIPIALFFTGERSGNYRVKLPLIDLAEMQLELYRALSREDQILTYAGHPMLKGVGMLPPKPEAIIDPATRLPTGREKPAAQIEVGPSTVLFAPPAGDGINTDWDFIQPNADNIRAVREHVKNLTEDFRRLALQPTTSNSGNLTATGAAIEGAKSHSAIEVWANGLKATLDQALKYTAEWLKIADTVTASVHTDFGVGTMGAERIKNVMQLGKDGVISKQTTFEEALRDGTLASSRSWDDEQERVAEEQEGLVGEEDVDPRTGLPIPPQPPVPPPAGNEPQDDLQEAA